MIYLIMEKVEKNIELGDYVECDLFNNKKYLYEVIEDTYGSDLKIMVDGKEICLSSSHVVNVWSKK